jgi:hypothetical protein
MTLLLAAYFARAPESERVRRAKTSMIARRSPL